MKTKTVNNLFYVWFIPLCLKENEYVTQLVPVCIGN